MDRTQQGYYHRDNSNYVFCRSPRASNSVYNSCQDVAVGKTSGKADEQQQIQYGENISSAGDFMKRISSHNLGEVAGSSKLSALSTSDPQQHALNRPSHVYEHKLENGTTKAHNYVKSSYYIRADNEAEVDGDASEDEFVLKTAMVNDINFTDPLAEFKYRDVVEKSLHEVTSLSKKLCSILTHLHANIERNSNANNNISKLSIIKLAELEVRSLETLTQSETMNKFTMLVKGMKMEYVEDSRTKEEGIIPISFTLPFFKLTITKKIASSQQLKSSSYADFNK
ncbi:hypothetical protein HDU76_008981 [Blyttiomyces sp. JEL0837]|nr:hypothetical protein HDU76_008981 [Blyttiomyces sp. JEL0837]